MSPINIDDAELFAEWLNDPEVARYLSTLPMSLSLPVQKTVLERLAREHVYSIIDLATDKLIGNVGLEAIDTTNRFAEIGIFIGNKAYWGKGYGTEAMTLLIDYAFDTLNLHTVRLCVYAFNTRAQACYRNIGFQETGRRRQAIFRDGTYHDVLLMDVLEDEWRARHPVCAT